MTIFFLLLVIASVTGTLFAVWREDRGPLPAPRSRREDSASLPPGRLVSFGR